MIIGLWLVVSLYHHFNLALSLQLSKPMFPPTALLHVLGQGHVLHEELCRQA